MSTAPARNRDRGFVHYDVQECEFKYNTFRLHSALGYRPPAPETVQWPPWPRDEKLLLART